MGIKKKILLKLVDKFEYHAKYKDIGFENELCALLVGKVDPKEVKPNKQEVAEIMFMSLKTLKSAIRKNPKVHTPWLKIALKRLRR